MSQITFPVNRFQQLDTPFYYYDLYTLQQTLSAISEATQKNPHYQVHYAVKANANPRLLSLIAKAGFGADCVSGGEIQAALNAGFLSKKIVYAGVGKSDKEILSALRAGIFCFNVESVPELEVINQLAAAQGVVANVALRINPNVDAHTHAKITTGLAENKFGIAMEDMLPTLQRADVLTNVRCVGLHFHIGSQIEQMDSFVHLCERINELQDGLEAAGHNVEHINVGGGLGVDYIHPLTNPIPQFRAYFDTFRAHLHLRPQQTLHFELGRSVVAQCGHLISRVLYVKEGHIKRFAILDAGMTDLVRPAMYGSRHAISLLDKQGGCVAASDTNLHYDVVGPICESSDVFATDLSLPLLQRGDLLALHSAGAYGEVMASTYNCRPLAPSYYSDELNAES